MNVKEAVFKAAVLLAMLAPQGMVQAQSMPEISPSMKKMLGALSFSSGAQLAARASLGGAIKLTMEDFGCAAIS